MPVTVKNANPVGIVIPSMLWTLLSASNLQVWRLLQYMAVLRSKCTVDMLIGLYIKAVKEAVSGTCYWVMAI